MNGSEFSLAELIVDGRRRRFTRPTETFAASNISEVRTVIERAAAAAEDGKWAILVLSYEAAPAFDKAFRTHPASDFPLAIAAIFSGPDGSNTLAQRKHFEVGRWQASISQADYSANIDRIRELIARGDTYQVNYTFPLRAAFSGDAETWYRDLSNSQTAPYSAFIDLGRYQILSLSPELFFARTGNVITAKPMKGTIRRGRFSSEDASLAEELANSAKDRAENIMIVDLLRNDLGQVSDIGSVRVTNLCELERYETVWQLTSTIEAELSIEISLFELFRALFPCGSITGAPKIRTMEIIAHLEKFPRNVYTGCIGVIKPGGTCIFNVAIRTVLIDRAKGEASFGVGGGITFQSRADREYEECLVKSAFLDERRPEFQLLESILLEDGELFLAEAHRARLRDSARYFGFALDEQSIDSHLHRVASENRRGHWKVRLLVSKRGSVETEVEPISELNAPVEIALAAAPVDSTDVFLFHKTTHRAAYEAALASRPGFADVVLWNNRGEVTESTVANVVVELDGALCTPPVTSELLAGTFRQHLLAKGEIRERVIQVDELKNAREFFLINSVRRWRRAVLV